MEIFDVFITSLLAVLTFFWIIVLVYHAPILIAFLTLSSITLLVTIISLLREENY